jgi:hypothetical protein
MMTDVDVMQWLFDLERFTTGMNWPVNVAGLIDAKRSLDNLTSEGAPAIDVVMAFKAFAGAIGPTVMNGLLESDDAFPEVNHSGVPTPPSPGKITLYVDPTGKRVLAEVTREWGAAPAFSMQ